MRLGHDDPIKFLISVSIWSLNFFSITLITLTATYIVFPWAEYCPTNTSLDAPFPIFSPI